MGGVSKTQTSKRKRKDELRDLNSLRSRAKAVFVFVTRLCFLGLCLQGLRFRGLRFRVLENADLEYPKVDNERCYRFRGLRFRDTRFLGITIDAN